MAIKTSTLPSPDSIVADSDLSRITYHVIVMAPSTCTCHAEKSTAGKIEDRAVRELDNLIPEEINCSVRNSEVWISKSTTIQYALALLVRILCNYFSHLEYLINQKCYNTGIRDRVVSVGRKFMLLSFVGLGPTK